MTEPGTSDQPGRIIVISGPSGSGKTTVCNRLLEDPNVRLSVSATTRTPRPGERDGVNYHFLTRTEFARRVQQGVFAEHAEYNGNLYGTPRAELDAARTDGQAVLVEIDVQGAAQLRRRYPHAIYIFLDAPADAVAERLERRNTETPDERRHRLDAAQRERAAGQELFDVTVINDDLDQAVQQIRSLIRDGKPGPRTACGGRTQ